jgi:hypothetical protein
MTAPAATAARNTTKPKASTAASTATTPRPRGCPPKSAASEGTAQVTAKPGGQISEQRKTDASNKLIVALSMAGHGASAQQLIAINGDWLSNNSTASFWDPHFAIHHPRRPRLRRSHLKTIKSTIDSLLADQHTHKYTYKRLAGGSGRCKRWITQTEHKA